MEVSPGTRPNQLTFPAPGCPGSVQTRHRKLTLPRLQLSGPRAPGGGHGYSAVGRVRNQHPGGASVHGGLGRYHVDLVLQCGLFCSATGCRMEITQKGWLKLCLPKAAMLLLVVFSLVWLILLGCFFKKRAAGKLAVRQVVGGSVSGLTSHLAQPNTQNACLKDLQSPRVTLVAAGRARVVASEGSIMGQNLVILPPAFRSLLAEPTQGP